VTRPGFSRDLGTWLCGLVGFLLWLVVIVACLIGMYFVPGVVVLLIPGWRIYRHWADSRTGFNRYSAPIVQPRTYDATDPLWDRELDG
jgi:hypothetical protein